MKANNDEGSVTFISRWARHRLTRGEEVVKMGGRDVTRLIAPIQFINNQFTTSDPVLIAFIKGHQEYGSVITSGMDKSTKKEADRVKKALALLEQEEKQEKDAASLRPPVTSKKKGAKAEEDEPPVDL